MADGWQKTTRSQGKYGRLRQMLRRRRLSRLRFTALPSLRRTTKFDRGLLDRSGSKNSGSNPIHQALDG